MFSSKILLITVGIGSFGNAILNRFLNTYIKEIRVFRMIKKQNAMRVTLNNPKVKLNFRDVPDCDRIEKVMCRVWYFFKVVTAKRVSFFKF